MEPHLIGTVIDAVTRLPVEGARVSVFDTEPVFWVGTDSDEQGRYEIEGDVPEDLLRVKCEIEGYVTQHVLLSRAAVGDGAPIDFELRGDGVMTGCVRWQDEQPLPGAQVHLVRDGQVIENVRTRADGTYTFRHLPVASYDLVVEHPRLGALSAVGLEVGAETVRRDFEFAIPETARAPWLGQAAQGLRDIWDYRHLIQNLVLRDMRTRYKESVLGLFWSMLLPLAQIAVYAFVFKYVWATVKMPNYTIFLFCGLVPWLYFHHSMSDACNAILGNRALVTRVRVPAAVLPTAVVFQNLVHFALMLVVFVIVLQMVPVNFFLPVIILPLLILLEIILNMGLAFFLAALNTFYQDVAYGVAVLLQFLLFLSPILYSGPHVLETVHSRGWPEWVYTIYMLNPVAILTTAYRDIFLGHITDGIIPGTDPVLADPAQWTPVFPEMQWLLVLAIEAVVALVVGYLYFMRRQARLGDEL